jgi:hypothetical protein
MKYLKSIISCAIISLVTPTLSFAQEAGWGYGSMCMARDCAPGREQMLPFRNYVGPNGPNIERNIAVCMEHAKALCGGVGYSSPNTTVSTIQYCSSVTSNELFQYLNATRCPPGQTPDGPPVPQYP